MQIPTIDHPTNRPNFSEVTLGTMTLWFSYRTAIGFLTDGWPKTTRNNSWGPTTGGHLSYIDGGRVEARLGTAWFLTALEYALNGEDSETFWADVGNWKTF